VAKKEYERRKSRKSIRWDFPPPEMKPLPLRNIPLYVGSTFCLKRSEYPGMLLPFIKEGGTSKTHEVVRGKQDRYKAGRGQSGALSIN
jgi:hypothetical protein